MKRILFLLNALIIINTVESQILSSDKIWVTFADTTTQLSGSKATTKAEINTIFNEYDVTEIVPLFPFAKTPYICKGFQEALFL